MAMAHEFGQRFNSYPNASRPWGSLDVQRLVFGVCVHRDVLHHSCGDKQCVLTAYSQYCLSLVRAGCVFPRINLETSQESEMADSENELAAMFP